MSVPEAIVAEVPSAASETAVTTPPLRAVSGGAAARGDPALAQWLGLLCRMLPGVQQAYVGLQRNDQGEFTSHAAWPGTGAASAELALAASGLPAQDRLLVKREAGRVRLGRYYLRPGLDHVAVVLEMSELAEGQQDTVAALMDWGGSWLTLLLRNASPDARPSPMESTRGVILAALERGQLVPSAVTLAAGLAQELGCARVSIGLVRAHRVQLLALSSGAEFDARSRHARTITAAMDEVLDEQCSVSVPALEEREATATRAHERLRGAENRAGVCSVIMALEDRRVGVITVESAPGQPHGEELLRVLEATAPAAAAVLSAKSAARGVRGHTRAAMQAGLAALLGKDRPLVKLIGVAVLAVLAAGLVLDGDYRVSAPATLEGAVHRSLIAPIDGFVARAPARAGDAVSQGEVLAELDTRDLELQRRRFENERSEIKKAYRKAVATMDRADVRVQKARLGKLGSQIALVDEQIGRARVVAPFDGLVMRGDLSHSLGAPVNRGDVLFEMAPLDDYRVALMVDERDVGTLAPGQTGHLALSALPGDTLAFAVETIVGVAETTDGRNAFRVEARLERHDGLLRPGMLGVGKVLVDQRPLLWVWTHALTDRIRLWLWSHAP